MESNRSEGSNKVFNELLKKYYEELSNKNKKLKEQLAKSKKSNETFFKRIQQSTNNSLTPVTTSTDVMPKLTENLLEKCVHYMNNKVEEVQTLNHTIVDTTLEETKRCKETYYEMITKDDAFLKPYHEVEESTQKMQQNAENTLQERNEKIQNHLEILKQREQYFIQLKKDNTILEPMTKEMRLKNENTNAKKEEKLKSLNLTSAKDATMESLELKELHNEISLLKSQLNIY